MNYKREIALTRFLLALTVVAGVTVLVKVAEIGLDLVASRDWLAVAMQLVFAVVVLALMYGFFVYPITRLGYLRRRMEHTPAGRHDLDAIYTGVADALAVLVPSYKEEPAVVRRTLLSAALQEYPGRRVVLLIDDPLVPRNAADAVNLQAMRRLPQVLQTLFDRQARQFGDAHDEFVSRCGGGAMDPRSEARILAGHFDAAAAWFDRQIGTYRIVDHGDTLFVTNVLLRWRDEYRERAERFVRLADSGEMPHAEALREYQRLCALFHVTFDSFERKRYANLSHEVNKAMNLNSYIGLMGKSFREIYGSDKALLLREAPRGPGTLDVPDAALVLTLDADSVLLPDYALRLAHVMNLRGNERLAVVQTPYSAFPGAPGVLERVAGATTDIQYLIHQGFTQFHATFWVGANALLRKAALEDICTTHVERGHPIRKYIQDRTVIEDTESSVDLVARGWSLHNYPERLAYSATPSDFGSLLIQRRRWANGGLIILPKALRYLFRGPLTWLKAGEAFLRVHYLTSIFVANVALLVVLFGAFERNMRIAWLLVCSLPYMALYARDLVLCGYRWSDFLRVYALNLLLVPIHLGGALKSLHQAATGKRTPFGRTPKVTGRTVAPGAYVAAECGLFVASAVMVGVNVQSGAWWSASFALAYAVFCAYAIWCFIGLRNGIEDLGLWLRPQKPLGGDVGASHQNPAPNIVFLDMDTLESADHGNRGMLAGHDSRSATAVPERHYARESQRLVRTADGRIAAGANET